METTKLEVELAMVHALALGRNAKRNTLEFKTMADSVERRQLYLSGLITGLTMSGAINKSQEDEYRQRLAVIVQSLN